VSRVSAPGLSAATALNAEWEELLRDSDQGFGQMNHIVGTSKAHFHYAGFILPKDHIQFFAREPIRASSTNFERRS
jgi:hypothetical protein